MIKHINILVFFIMSSLFLIFIGWQYQQNKWLMSKVRVNAAKINELNKHIDHITEIDLRMIGEYNKVKDNNLILNSRVNNCETFIFKKGLWYQYGSNKPEEWDKDSKS